jgi:hypothetical protein
MGNKSNQWAARSRARLIAALGGRCQRCREIADLTVDVLRASDTRHHGMSPAQRVSYYWREYRRGNLRILCAGCHAQDAGRQDGYSTQRTSMTPVRARVNRILRASPYASFQGRV